MLDRSGGTVWRAIVVDAAVCLFGASSLSRNALAGRVLAQQRRGRRPGHVGARRAGASVSLDMVSVISKYNIVASGPEDAQPMLFAHGFGCDQNMWRLVAPAFAEVPRHPLRLHRGRRLRLLSVRLQR